MIADRPRRTRHSGRGFSTVELMIALCVLTFGVYAVYDRFIESGDASRRQIKQAQAELAAAQRLAELRAAPIGDLKSWTPAADWERTSEGIYLRTTIASMKEGGVEIEVSAVWGAEPETGDEPPQDRVKRAKGVVLP